MRVLVTGGAGFIGSHMVEGLLERGDEVVVLDDLSTGKRENLPSSHPKLKFVEGDVADAAQLEACLPAVEAVVHLAAVASVQASIEDPVATHRVNFDGSLALLETSRRHGVGRFLYACSAAVYGDTEKLPVGEDVTPNPLSPYAIDKLAGEYYLQYFFRQYGLNATSFRFFNIYGPRQDPSSPYSGVISQFMDRARQGRGVTIYGDGEQTRDFVFVGDLVRLLLQALDRMDLGGEVINVGTGRSCSLLELLDAIEAIVGHQVPREHVPVREGDIRHSRADVTHLRALMGSVPDAPIVDGLRALLGD